MECSICKKKIEPLIFNGKVIWDKGNNAEPINSGRCCDKCNNEVVVVKRIEMYREKQKKNENI